MDKEKIILLIVGAIIGFFVSLAKDWLMESKKQKEKYKQFKREKLEKAFMILNDYQNKIISPELISLNEGEYNSLELTMIIKFYFPNLEVFFDEYILMASEFSLKLKLDKESNGIKNIYKKYGEMCKLLIEESKKI